MVLGFAVAIYRLIFEWDNNKNDLLSVLVVNPGGLAIYGGVLGGVVVAVAFRAKCKMFSRHLQKPILKTEKGRFKGL